MSLDAELLALRRRFETDPTDAKARWSYVVALVRAGRREAARALLRGRFLCPLQWEELPVGNQNRNRWCEECENWIQFASTGDELRRTVEARRCVAAPTELVEGYAESQVDAVLADPDAPGRPPRCVLEVESVVVGTIPRQPDPEALEALAGASAHQLGIFPVAIDEAGRLEVLADQPLSPERVEDIRFATGREIGCVGVVDRNELARAIAEHFPREDSEPFITMGVIMPEALDELREIHGDDDGEVSF